MAKHYVEVQELYVKRYVIKLPIEFATDEEAEEYVKKFGGQPTLDVEQASTKYRLIHSFCKTIDPDKHTSSEIIVSVKKP